MTTIIEQIENDRVMSLEEKNVVKHTMLATILADLQVDDENAVAKLISKYQKALSRGPALTPYIEYLEQFLNGNRY